MVKQKLNNLDSTKQPQTALVTLAKSSRPVVTKPSKAARKKPRNYCKKHFPSQANDQTWNKCERLRGKYKQKGVIATEVANMTTGSLDNVSKSNFIFDTGASAHVCPSLDRFNNISKCSGLVNTSSGEPMEVRGKGTVNLRCKLSNGCISKFVLSDVLYVPKLTHSLLSWNRERLNGYELRDDGKVMRLLKGDQICLEKNFKGSLPVVVESDPFSQDIACMTYKYWHQALCHSSPITVSKTEMDIQDSKLIPVCPKDFHCEACALSKSTHKKPHAVRSRASARGEYLHSDLCGPFPMRLPG